MSEFKITSKTTLYELQEHCRNNDCDTCCLNERECYCRFIQHSPDAWNIKKPKTYKEDFLEKFPNAAKNEYGTLCSCRALIYDGSLFCNNRGLNCEKCWNQIMEEENE